MAVVKKLVADFETTTLEDDCRVWAACIYDIYDKKKVLKNKGKFIKISLKFLFNYKKRIPKNPPTRFIHNKLLLKTVPGPVL